MTHYDRSSCYPENVETYLQDKSDIFSETEIYHVTKQCADTAKACMHEACVVHMPHQDDQLCFKYCLIFILIVI